VSGLAERRIWLVADDYGISPAVSAAIRDLLARGRLSATSVMMASPGVDAAAVQDVIALRNAGKPIAIGLHVTLTGPFRPLTRTFTPLRDGTFLPLAPLMARALLGRLDPAPFAAEIAAQLAAFETAFGRPPDYVDGHQHAQLMPTVRDAFLDAVKAAAPGAWVRQCGMAAPPLRRLADPKGLLLDQLSRGFRARAAARGIATNPAFAGTYDFSATQPLDVLFAAFFAGLPDGGVVMCHPGEVDDTLRRLDPVTDQRAREYAFLASDAFADLMRAQGIALR
jgi:predicted glycoside hydrolase/deacetylase ChbG (UPF0249 family)